MTTPKTHIATMLCLAFLPLLTQTTTAEGKWESLHTGNTLDGWKVECRQADRGKNYWRSVKGTIECDTRGDRKHDYVWLVSEREFGDFEFECLVQSIAGSTGNSGIQIRSRFLKGAKYGAWLHGPQVDIHPRAPWRSGMIYDETRETRRWISPPMPSAGITPDKGAPGWKWVHADGKVLGTAPSPPHVYPSGTWNHLRIVAHGPHIKTIVNGVVVTDFDGTGILDDEAHQRHRVGMRGHLALQLHARDDLKIRFRDLRIRELTTPPPPSHVRLVTNDTELRAALSKLTPGTTVRLAPGRYRPGITVRDAHGTPERPLVLEGLDPRKPPLFHGGNQAWHLSDVSHLTLRWMHCRGQKFNGINLDDGGSYDTPSHHVRFSHLDVADVGPTGNTDGIKCSGVDHLQIRHTRVSGWGGQAIDFVGCHHAEIAHCTIVGKKGFSQHTGPQFKGGSSDISIHHCRLENAGMRPIQAGGSTGLAYFRPSDAPFEAARIHITDNTLIGGQCALAFTGVEDCDALRNTVLNPEKWVFRILQENTAPRFAKCGKVLFSENHIVFQRAKVRGVVNIGPNTRPETFVFRGNHWHASDAPEKSRPQLPTKEEGGVYGAAPKTAPRGRKSK